MNYKYKYLKYKTQYLKLKNMSGGNITWATPEYIENIISSTNPELTKCDLIKDIRPRSNEGRHNDGIGFITIEGKEYFLKYGFNLFNEFKTGYMLSKLRSVYPYFLNVHSLFNCDYIPKNSTESVNGQVMIVDKARGETIYNYLNRKSKEYILDLIPDLEDRVRELDEHITKIINDNLTVEEKGLINFELKKKNKIKYDSIISTVNEVVKSFYLSLSIEIIQFQSEFVPLFIKNYKTLIDSYMIVDIFTLNKYNNYISDKKSDNFMVTTESYNENKTHINIKLGSQDIRINNICEWHNTQEYCFIYPVDFGSAGDMNYSELDKDLLSYFLNQWIYHYARLYLHSDININNLESGNILSLGKNKIELRFSSFSYQNQIAKIDFSDIFEKYNKFIIKIFNPLEFYIEGMASMSDNTELQILLEQNPLRENDHRFIRLTKKFFNINTLEEACNVLQLLLSGYTVEYDEYSNTYSQYSNLISYSDINGISENQTFLDDDSDENVYNTFVIS
jgi:hypothetical protein